MVTPGRSYSSGTGYRYGFNGKENDNEVKGTGNQQDYGFRIYDPRLGRFLSVDPLNREYPWYTPYQFAGNKPISFIDRDGLEEARFDEKIYGILNPIDATTVDENATKAKALAFKSKLPDQADGKQDAFRHSIWNALSARDIGADDAEPFTTPHESGSPANDPNSSSYDPIAVRMDLHNNAVGIRIGAAHPYATDDELVKFTQQALANGELLEIKMGNFDVNVLGSNGKFVKKTYRLAISAKGNPISIDPKVVPVLLSNNYTIDPTTEKIIQTSSHPTLAANNNKTPELPSEYGEGVGTNFKKVQPLNNVPIKDNTTVVVP
ncbi:hypothetical protein BH10BAC2_BH10BAC2_25230 [soil metagenome]